jgi:hypothetical protein
MTSLTIHSLIVSNRRLEQLLEFRLIGGCNEREPYVWDPP